MANKSKLYQYKIVEISFDASKLNNFATDRGIGHVLEQNTYDDRIKKFQEDIMDKLYDIIYSEGYLTEHQRTILLMRLMGKTQNEIAEHLGITQSAVHKAMHGNIDYKNNKKRYGGVVKKLKKICEIDGDISVLLNKIGEIKKEKSDD